MAYEHDEFPSDYNYAAAAKGIPQGATKPGTMTIGNGANIPLIMLERYATILSRWQDAVNEQHYVTEKFTHAADQVHGHFGKTYARLDIGTSGAFMVDMLDGFIYGIKGYGKVDKKKCSGNIAHPDFDAAVLVRDRFRRGRFNNNIDGSIPVLPRHGNTESR